VTRFRVVPNRSRLWIEATSSLHPIRIETTGLEGAFEAALVDDQPDLTVQPTGCIEIGAERLMTGNVLYDRELERRLEMRKYPRIRGEIVAVQADGDDRYHVRGNLSLHGVTWPVEGRVRVRVRDDGTVEAEGEQTFDMRDFKLDPPRLLMLRVHPEVRVRGRLVAVREE
jgi:polyisoprenoid-binding protein YceI